MTRTFSFGRGCVIALHHGLYLLLAVTISCMNPTSSSGGGGDEPLGSLQLTISEGLSAQLIQPDIDMQPAHFEVGGAGPGDRSFQVSHVLQGDSVAVDRLVAGVWTVTVVAFNEDDTSVGSGETEVTILPGEQVTASVEVVPFDGSGTFELTIGWVDGVVYGDQQDAEVTLTSVDGNTVIDVAMIQGEAGFSGGASGLDAGYYTLSMKLFDGAQEVWGAIDTVRIVKNELSSGAFVLTPSEVSPIIGDINVEIINGFHDPLEVTLAVSGAPVNAEGGDSAVVTAQVGTAGFDPASASYTWFIDGNAQDQDGDTLSLTPGLLSALKPNQGQGARVFRIDVVVLQGTALSSANATIVLVYPDVIAHDDGVDDGPVAAIAADETYPGRDATLNGWSFENTGSSPWVKGSTTNGEGTKINWYFWWDHSRSVRVSDIETFWVELRNRTDKYTDGHAWIQLYTHPEGEGDGGSWYRSTARYYLSALDFPENVDTLFSIGTANPDAARFVGIDGTENAIHQDIMDPGSGSGPFDDSSFSNQTVLAIALATNSGAQPSVLEFTVRGAGHQITGMGQREFITVAGD